MVCSEGVGKDCLDFRLKANIEEEELWSPEGYYWYNGELIPYQSSQLMAEQQLEILDTHPFFTGKYPSCGHEFDRCNLPIIHWDCPAYGWVDDSV